VPENYLSKLLSVLRKAGIVAATRGSGGGYRLEIGALEVPLVKIIEMFDGPRVRPACLLGQEYRCSDENPCPAHNPWRGVREAYLGFIENTRLVDIARYPLREFRTIQRRGGMIPEIDIEG
jgi:Rrf2 family protein